MFLHFAQKYWHPRGTTPILTKITKNHKSVICDTYSYAEKVAIQSALIVGSGFYHHKKHKYLPGYYPHFHVQKVPKKPHIWYY